MSQRIPHVVRLVQERPWAILPATLEAILDVVSLHAAGERFTPEEIQARIGAAAKPAAERAGVVAILPLFGVISQRMNMMTDVSGGTSTEAFGRAFREAVADPAVEAIVLAVDSPGGSVFGIDELGAEIFDARSQKPIVAVADSLAASAAYWLAAQASELVVTPGGQVGSIGVFAAHRDLSKAYADAGMKHTLISAGKYKTEGNPYGPLTDDARAAMQDTVDQYYGLFVKAVARGRGVSVGDVRGGFGEGRVVTAKDAVAARMADRIDTLANTVNRLASRRAQRALLSPAAATAADTVQEPERATTQDPPPGLWRGQVDVNLVDLD
jgi:signal peptide peptidase SppA